MCDCSVCRLPIIIGGFNLSTAVWYMLFILYACLAVFVFTALYFAKKKESEAQNDENVSPMYLVSICASKDDEGNLSWNATSTDIEGVVGVGESPAEAVDNLLSQIDKQKIFENIYSTKEESPKEKKYDNNTDR